MPLDNPSEQFVDQFEWDGMELIYRSRGIGPAYRMSVDEYHAFLGNYDRNRQVLTGLGFAGWLLIMVIAFADFPPGLVKGTFDLFALYVGLALLFWAADRWLLGAPARAMRARAPDLAALSDGKRLDRVLGENAWTKTIVATTLAGLAMAGFVWIAPDRPTTWGYWVLLILLTGLLGRSAVTMLKVRRLLIYRRKTSDGFSLTRTLGSPASFD